MFTIEIFIPRSLNPIHRGDLYDLPLCDVFDRFGDGDIVGGGTRMNKDKVIVSCLVEIEVINIERILPSIIEVLEKANSPAGTMIKQLRPEVRVLYEVGGS